MKKALFALFLIGTGVGLYLVSRPAVAEPEDLAGETKPIYTK